MDKRTKVRNTLVITILTIALIAFFNYAFEGDWVSIGIFTACIVFPVLILLDGSLTKIERSRIFRYLYSSLLCHLLLGSLRTGGSFFNSLRIRTDES